MTRKRQIKSSATYYIDPRHLRQLGVELKQRNRENAYRSHAILKHKTDAEPGEAYDKLKTSIATKGFCSEQPILIHLNRKNGKDKILKDGGHHRLAAAIDLGLEEVPVRFVYDVPVPESSDAARWHWPLGGQCIGLTCV